MSYIRALSNPEGLYIIVAGSDEIEIIQRGQPLKYCHISEFQEILNKWLNGDHEPTEVGQLKLYEDHDHMWCLEHKVGWTVKMYETTLYYLASTNEFRWKESPATREVEATVVFSVNVKTDVLEGVPLPIEELRAIIYRKARDEIESGGVEGVIHESSEDELLD